MACVAYTLPDAVRILIATGLEGEALQPVQPPTLTGILMFKPSDSSVSVTEYLVRSLSALVLNTL